jgi:ribA/ribD-fused uncharacterized protein
MTQITSFLGQYRFLSNFWPCYLVYHDLIYPSAEHAYQSAKVESPEMKARIQSCETPVAAKDFLEKNGIKPEKWNITKKLAVMEELLKIKFGGMDPLLTRALLDTDNAELIEGNTWNDTFWGVCNNQGENNLGKLLMKIRQELVHEKQAIHWQLEKCTRNIEVADALSLSTRQLYEKMIAFGIKNKEFWIG